jgi:ABC-2 type transport system ATP-binding protein
VSKPFVEIEKLSKRFPDEKRYSLKEISAAIEPGKIVGLAGPDGAGKTTLIRLVAGLLVPTSGRISVLGFDTVKDAEEIHALIGYMPQKFGLYEDLTVLQNLTLYAELRGLENDLRKEVFDRLLSFTALHPFTSRLAGNLSGGMKQKLGLACALIKKPTLLLLDEPSVGVDPISRRQLWKMVQDLVKEGISVLWSTAYLDEAEKCDSVILLNEGELIFDGRPQELCRRVEGRVFAIKNIETNRRDVLAKALLNPQVIDGVIQASDVRLLVKEKDTLIDLAEFNPGPSAYLEAVTPRFEDAFIDILGGIALRSSQLAEQFEPLDTTHEAMIEASNLTKKFGDFTAVDAISLSIKPGEIFGLLGPNGAGKTTTFKMMCGLLKATSGRAVVNGVDLMEAPAVARAHIGYMAQKFSLYSNLSLLQNLDFFSGIYNLSGHVQKEAIERVIKVFSMSEYCKVNAELLPLGYKQRLSLSCAVMHRPTVLFLDEPTSGVDPLTRREFWTHINGLVTKGVTVLVTTHFMDEAEYCDRIALIYKGQKIVLGTPDELKTMAKTAGNSQPTLEDAFIYFIERYDEQNHVS